jgi:hypothetical protein
LDVAECRKLTGADCPLTDLQLLVLRDQLYDLAHVVLDAYKRTGRVAEDLTTLEHLTVDERETVEERAAVLEFEAGMSREIATRTALALRLNGRSRTRRLT